MGLANRVVPDGQALAAAIELARQIAAHPQECLRNDRASVLGQHGEPLRAAHWRRSSRSGTRRSRPASPCAALADSSPVPAGTAAPPERD